MTPMTRSGRRVSMSDVAARAGVSGQTVSRVVNGSPRVDPATRARVEAALQALDYRPHRAARALRTGRTQTLGLVAATLATVGNSRMLQAVADAAAARGYSLVVVTLGAVAAGGAGAGGAVGAGGAAVVDAFERLRDQGVDGAIVLNEATQRLRGAQAPEGMRLVVVDSPDDDRFTVVQTDHAAGAREAVSHLLALGHRTVHHLAGPAGSFPADERERGWREALAAAAGVATVGAGAEAAGGAQAPVGVPEVVRGDWSAASGYEVGALLAADPEVTAVFCANDQMALGLLRALDDVDRQVPEDVSVVGFDDVADAAQYHPPLTTVRQDFDALGEHAVDVLVSAIEKEAARRFDVLPARLILRASTAAPR